MRLVVLLAVLGLLVSLFGILAFAKLPSDSVAVAAVADQPREDQIPFPDRKVNTDIGSWSTTPPDLILALDPADYPPSTTFRLQGIWLSPRESIKCIRLFDLTTASPLEETEVCSTNTDSDSVFVRLRSEPVALPAGEHEYSVQARCDQLPPTGGCGGSRRIESTRIIAEWVAPNSVGGVSLDSYLRPLSSETDGGSAPIWIVTLGIAAALCAVAFGAGAWVTRRHLLQ